MASRAPQPVAQSQGRRSSPSSQTTESNQQSIATKQDDPRPHGDSSQTSPDEESSSLLNPKATTSTSPTSQNNTQRTSSSEPRKCWICMEDETEDTPDSTPWRSPCPCALDAHEGCLLDWIADLENPRNRKRRPGSKIQCPQCKSEIRIVRPRSLALDALQRTESLIGRLILPGLGVTLGGMVWAGASAHGYYSLNIIFGTEDTRRLLHLDATTHMDWGRWARVNFGLATIPVVLVSSQISYTEPILPVVPVLLFASYFAEGQQPSYPDFVWPSLADVWPPSAAMTFSVLPYVRMFYNKFHGTFIAPHERRWLQEMQPRSAETETEGNADQRNPDVPWEVQQAMADDEGMENDIMMQLELDINVINDDDDENDNGDQAAPPPPDIPRDRAPEAGNAENQNQNQEGNGDQNQGQNQNQNQNQNQGQGQGAEVGAERIVMNSSGIATTMLGALFFPTLSAAMGQLLKMGLPKRFTHPNESGRPGLLQTRWGRSVVGGCLFVVLKDALLFYCRWKLLQMHRQRRILDWDRKGKGVERS